MLRPPDRRIDVPAGFDFQATVYSHGWCVLAPFGWDREAEVLRTKLPVASGVAGLALDQPGDRGRPVRARIESGRGSRAGLDERGWGEIEAAAVRMLRLDADLTPFIERAREAGDPFAGAVERGFGRLLRAPTVFEDVVKVLATTNTTWGGTVAMVANLVEMGGDGAFPAPAAVAAMGAERLADRGRWGYRAAYLAGLAEAVATGELDLDRWASWEGSTEELEAEIRSVPGLGPYAAAHVLALLGRYDRIGVDTVFRNFVRRKYFPRARKPPRDERMLKIYAGWGEWRALAYWADLWHTETFEG